MTKIKIWTAGALVLIAVTLMLLGTSGRSQAVSSPTAVSQAWIQQAHVGLGTEARLPWERRSPAQPLGRHVDSQCLNACRSQNVQCIGGCQGNWTCGNQCNIDLMNCVGACPTN
jgi:hypothetical protein